MWNAKSGQHSTHIPRHVLQGRDQFEQMDHYTHRQHAGLRTCCSYWSTNFLISTPFFGTYLSRNKFKDILWNFQVADSKNNPPPGSPNHDPLAKVCPLLEMCQTKFRLRYTPAKYISLDESTKDVSNFAV